MASTINIQNLTLNPKEQGDFAKFVMELSFNKPELKAMHNVFTGVNMKEQIVMAGHIALSGKKASGCTRQTSGKQATLTQKYWEPVGIEDTFTNCQADVNGLFKAYYDKIQDYKQMYDIDGSDEQLFIAARVEEAMSDTIDRAIWFGDKDVAASESGVAGLKDGDNAYAFDYIDGLWKQIFTGVSGSTISRVDISTLPTQPTSAQSLKAFDDVYKAADPRLRSDVNAKFYVSGQLYLGLMYAYRDESFNFTLERQENGTQVLKYFGHEIVNMENIWDKNLEYFEADKDTGAAYLPNRIVFTTPSNIPVATMNEEDMNSLESWYNQDERVNKVAYGFTLDAKVIFEDLIVVAY